MGDDGHEGRSIDYDALPSCLAERAVEPGDRDYDDVRSTYVWPGSPGLVLCPSTPQQVAEALAFARRHDVPLAVRSGGHGINRRSANDGGIVIDLRALSMSRSWTGNAAWCGSGPALGGARSPRHSPLTAWPSAPVTTATWASAVSPRPEGKAPSPGRRPVRHRPADHVVVARKRNFLRFSS